jgi:pyridoxine 5-phosphate synthase
MSSSASPRLFLNVDHVATLRQARRGDFPDPVEAALLAEASGHVDGITVHLREDRRHIQDRDVAEIRRRCLLPLNFELSVAAEIVELCLRTAPVEATLVPERREEVTTEGGLDLARRFDAVAEAVKRLRGAGIVTSLFIDPDRASVDRAAKAGATHVELHTGRYCGAALGGPRDRELEELRRAAAHAQGLGLAVNAGHGLAVDNVGPVAATPGIQDLNIGHALVGRAVFVGLKESLREMRAAMAAGVAAAERARTSAR